MIPLDQIRILNHRHRDAKRFAMIVQSIKNQGLKKPIKVSELEADEGEGPTYDLVCGQGRIEAFRALGYTEIPAVVVKISKEDRLLLALKQLGWKTVEIIVASEDDRFTYNARVNRLPPIQAHKMIVKAVKNGVKPERIAKALSMPMETVNTLLNLLDGVNPEATDILRDKHITAEAIRLLRKVSGLRQIEIAEVMVSANNFTKAYAEALVLATPKDQMLSPQEPKKKAGMTAEELSRMEREMEALEKDFKSIEANYSENMMSLTLGRGYIKRLLENNRVLRHLREHHGELLTEFETIATAESV
jgi:ParB-like chromosome segregation protein Spo0J